MPQEFDVTDLDIAYAESILLPAGKTFDEERRNYIKNFQTIDLQAVPGSGKTTALLAKLLILETKLPFDDGSGILILSHTNSAIDEIKEKIQNYCPKLFSYPNFIGTIQSFVDKYLAIPYYAHKFRKKPVRIDDEIYNERTAQFSNLSFANFTRQEQNNAKNILRSDPTLFRKIRFSHLENVLELTKGYNGKKLTFSKPKGRTKNYVDWTKEEKIRIRSWFFAYKRHFFGLGVLCFDDAYFLAFEYIQKFPQIKNIVQSRFSFVFVDEMQDMDYHQYNLLEEMFFCVNNSKSVYQRIGDKNQSIYNGNVKLENIWVDREIVLSLGNSQRLSPQVARLVERFALHRDGNFHVIGLNETGLKPYIFKYPRNSIDRVISTYLETIKSLQQGGSFPANPKYPIKVIAWNTIWNEDERPNNVNVRLIDYHSSFSRDENRPKIDHLCLKAYLIGVKDSAQTLRTARNRVLSALLKVLRIEHVTDQQGKIFTKTSLISGIKEITERDQIDYFDPFQQNLYRWSVAVHIGDIENVWEQIKEYVPIFLRIFDTEINDCTTFMNTDLDEVIQQRGNDTNVMKNVAKFDDLETELTTVHAVKGQTHSATLYLETSYYSQHETERLSSQIVGNPFNDNRARHKESTKMMYVGLSRPTHFLGIAISDDRFDALVNRINLNEWNVIEVANQLQHEE